MLFVKKKQTDENRAKYDNNGSNSIFISTSINVIALYGKCYNLKSEITVVALKKSENKIMSFSQ